MAQELNPYTPPLSNVVSENQAQRLEPAGKGRRFGTVLVDYACFTACGAIVGIFIGLVFGEQGIAVLQRIPDILLGAIVILFYYAFFEGIWARTPGKWVFGTVVVNDSGSKPSFSQVLKRTFSRFIPFEPFSFFGERGWHDSLSDTLVVRKRKTVK
jgi:uncharacterized RDD family membrane protein YckC